MIREDEKWMAVALECAALGLGTIEPNPMVGAVIVRDGVEISRGFHRRFGGPHAEIEALSAARDAGASVRGATMYVTLEPCCHHGKKTPPCTEAIIPSGIARVVAAMADPDEHVQGRGFEALRKAGISVSVGVMEAQARKLLAPYVKLRTHGRPWVICKWAQTADGFLALTTGRPVEAERWISCEESRRAVHVLRSYCDGICVGIGTVLADDPLLTNRSGAGRQPKRLVLDSHLRLPADCRLVATASESPVIVATTQAAITTSPQGYVPCAEPASCGRGTCTPYAARADALARRRIEIVPLPADAPGHVELPALLDELGRRQWTRLLVEGGASVLRSFIDQGLADELVVFVSPRRVADAPADLPRLNVDKLDLAGWELQERPSGPDTIKRFLRRG